MTFANDGTVRQVAGPLPLPTRFLLPVVALGVSAAFLAFPIPLEEKAHAALHGLCAQRPSHTYWFGDRQLPFDARMTGIYGGFLVTSIYLATRGRYRVFGLPTFPAIALLLAGVTLMGVDGLNSLLVDLGLWNPYVPRNELRLGTGLLTGLALAVAVCYLLSTTLWQRGRAGTRVIGGVAEIAYLLALQVPFAALVVSGFGPLYVPIAVTLVLAAVMVVSALSLIVLTIMRRRDNSYVAVRQLDGAATASLFIGILVMGMIAGGRFWIEQFAGVQPLS